MAPIITAQPSITSQFRSSPLRVDQQRIQPDPSFADPADERLYRKQQLAAAFRVFAKFGFNLGASGHISARDPELTDHFWVNPFGVSFQHIRVSDLILVDSTGRVVEGRYHVNATAFAIHSHIHQARPDVVAACHAHSTYGRALAALGRRLLPITQDVCPFFEAHDLFDEYTGVPDLEEGKRIAATLGGHKAVVLRNHGLLTVGDSVDAAAWWFVTMERSCQAQLLAEAAGTPVAIRPDVAEKTAGQTGSHRAGWAQFQPLYDQIVAEEPDLLEE
jgi:ribulose-5-phosphate 4-epimerase/fuculose-1-phosphate aldolase